jgi:hypothetical protein
MSRLLHAAARGARIEWLRSDGVWCKSAHCVPRIGPNAKYPWRIHPEDVHLQYGPISTALRESACTDKEALAGIPYIEGYWDLSIDEAKVFDTDPFHRSLFLLILAEALADEGL